MFVLTSDGGLVALKPSQFALEDDFQKMLEQHPELLAGDLIDPEEPRRWVLVSREIPVPGQADGPGLWSADHLFLDQDGIPTIVEVKRQTDTRLRREVVAQMLDYAANGCAYWTADSIQLAFAATCEKKLVDPEQELRDRFGSDLDPEKYWAQVKTNLDAEKIRLLFVADFIPRELKRIVEFLNHQMNPAEVLALELRHYTGENGLRTLAPTLFGQTEGARQQKSGTASTRKWDEDSFFSELTARFSPEIVAVARLITAWIEGNCYSGCVYGSGKQDGSITGYIRVNHQKLYPMLLMTSGKLYINFRDSMKPPFDDLSKRLQLLQRLNAIPGVKLSEDSVARQPAILLETLAVRSGTELLIEAMNWFVQQCATGTDLLEKT